MCSTFKIHSVTVTVTRRSKQRPRIPRRVTIPRLISGALLALHHHPHPVRLRRNRISGSKTGRARLAIRNPATVGSAKKQREDACALRKLRETEERVF